MDAFKNHTNQFNFTSSTFQLFYLQLITNLHLSVAKKLFDNFGNVLAYDVTSDCHNILRSENQK